jgi:hypothetical protein
MSVSGAVPTITVGAMSGSIGGVSRHSGRNTDRRFTAREAFEVDPPNVSNAAATGHWG